MYGQDDFELGTKVGLPKEHVVGLDGKFLPNTGFFSGRFAMEKDENGKPTLAVDVIKDLTERGLFFDKKNYEHTYPHCWRCKTPLIYYARDSWYIRMEDLRDELVKENEGINWEPSHIKEGRFGEWLRGIKDWAISRERYWGTPLPIWISEDGERLVVDSIETLRKYSKTPITKIIFVRHGQSEANVSGISSSDENLYPLTELGKNQVKETAKTLSGQNIDVVISSPIIRAKQTAEAYTELTQKEIIFDERLGEIKSGKWEGKTQHDESVKEERDNYKALPVEERYATKRGETGESWADLEKRVKDFLDEVLVKYAGKTILCFSHQGTNEIALKIIKKLSNEEAVENLFHSIDNAEIFYTYVDSRTQKEIDLHRPFIDGVVLEKDGKTFTRIKEVMDVWFDSGAMPFAQDHYPFEGKELLYPADFISEAIDQTRGWFYTLHAVGVLMGRGKAYKNVICLGHLLDAKGKKMSKSIGNIVNPWEMMDKYGVDTLRLWMYSVNQPGDSKNFDEKTVAEIKGKVFTLLYNVLAFYELYRDRSVEVGTHKTENVLDSWILQRLNELKATMTESLDSYKILEPVRAMRDFIDDLSTWYLRRSRDRIKGGDKGAKATLYVVLMNVAKLIAPFAPFTAEDLWQKLKIEGDEESVHLAKWSEGGEVVQEFLDAMTFARNFVTMGLEQRQKAGIKVRQPLKKLVIKHNTPTLSYWKELAQIIGDEVNVKEVLIENISEGDVSVALDTEITPELKREGDFREFLRNVQGLRKDANLSPSDMVNLSVPESMKDVIAGFEDELKKTAGIKEIKFEGEKLAIG
jgi:isoleucyl-tRNA synthetase